MTSAVFSKFFLQSDFTYWSKFCHKFLDCYHFKHERYKCFQFLWYVLNMKFVRNLTKYYFNLTPNFKSKMNSQKWSWCASFWTINRLSRNLKKTLNKWRWKKGFLEVPIILIVTSHKYTDFKEKYLASADLEVQLMQLYHCDGV